MVQVRDFLAPEAQAKMGLQEDDIILKYNEIEVGGVDELFLLEKNRMKEFKGLRNTTIRIMRNGEVIRHVLSSYLFNANELKFGPKPEPVDGRGATVVIVLLLVAGLSLVIFLLGGSGTRSDRDNLRSCLSAESIGIANETWCYRLYGSEEQKKKLPPEPYESWDDYIKAGTCGGSGC